MGEPAGIPRDADPASVAGDALKQRAIPDVPEIAELVALYRDHPRWAVWLPAEGRQWAAVRPAGSRPPGPEVPMLWVHAVTAGDLAGRMDRVDAGLSPG